MINKYQHNDVVTETMITALLDYFGGMKRTLPYAVVVAQLVLYGFLCWDHDTVVEPVMPVASGIGMFNDDAELDGSQVHDLRGIIGSGFYAAIPPTITKAGK